MHITGGRFCIWVSISTLFAGLNLWLFAPAFRETWYAPLHFLWVIAGACGVSWWCLHPCARRRTALLQAAALLAMACGISWSVSRVSWGGWIAGEARLPMAGGVLVLVTASLVAVAALIALGGSPLRTFQKGVLRRKADRS